MKALTLTQPWASLMADGRKLIETRSWRTSYRGELAIHAAKTWQPADRTFARTVGYWPLSLPLGQIVAVVEVYGCFLTQMRSLHVVPGSEEDDFGDYSPDRWGWLTRNVHKLPTPVYCKGALGLWTLPADVEALVRSQL